MTLVHDLQQKALEPNISIGDLLRNAYAVAFKLNLIDFERWLNNELKGYDNKEDLPQYRFITGIMRSYNPCYGWLDVTVSDNRLAGALENLPIVDKISEVEKLAEAKEEIYRQLPSEMAISFARNHYGMRAVIFLGKQQFHGIVDSVRTKILDWALVLEQKGVLGEEMTFSEKERTSAQNITINNFVGNVSNAPIQQGNGNIMNIEQCKGELDTAKFLVNEIKQIVDNMPNDETKETARADIETIERQLKSPAPKMNIVKELFQSLRNVLEGTMGSIIASRPAVAHAFNQLLDWTS